VLPIQAFSGSATTVAVGTAPLEGAVVAPTADGLGATTAGEAAGDAIGDAAADGAGETTGMAETDGTTDAAAGATTVAAGLDGANVGVEADWLAPMHAASTVRLGKRSANDRCMRGANAR
jgi:hypothetical protein